MLVRTEDGGVVVLEASGGCGVEANEWKNFVNRGWLKLYERYETMTENLLSQADLPKRQQV